MRLLAALLIVPVIGLTMQVEPVIAQDQAPKQRVAKRRNLATQCRKPAFAKANPKSCAKYVGDDNKPAAAPAQAAQSEPPTRPDFTADDQAAAIIPGVPDARFWSDSERDFLAV